MFLKPSKGTFLLTWNIFFQKWSFSYAVMQMQYYWVNDGNNEQCMWNTVYTLGIAEALDTDIWKRQGACLHSTDN